jgi:hypothetical protein
LHDLGPALPSGLGEGACISSLHSDFELESY